MIISWVEFFMGIAELAAKRSKDPRTQVGACIVKDLKIIGVGYNGMPNGCKDSEMPWQPNSDPIKSKYYYVVHAELNAILNSNTKFDRLTTMYCTLPPCNECAKAIIQSGIGIVIYSGEWRNEPYHDVAKILFKKANITLIPYNTLCKKE